MSFYSRSYAQQLYYSAEENTPHATGDVLQMPQLNVPETGWQLSGEVARKKYVFPE